MTQKERISAFREDLCDLCGLCLHLCPVMKLPIEEAKAEVNRLIKHEESKYALTKCNTCLSCNLFCPQQANPYQLILERWNDLYKIRGAPPLYRLICPTEQKNIWQLLNIFLSDKEKKWICKWTTYIPKLNDIVLLIGNYTHLFPFIIGDSKLLDYFKPIDRIDQWEGGAYLYQGGYLDIVKKIAKRTKEDFDKWNVKNVVACLDAVEYILNEVHQNEMGISYSQNFSNFNHWFLEKVNSEEIKLQRQLNITVTIHDNCYSKALGEIYWEQAREIIRRCGCKIIEMKHIKKDALCCGFGAGASWVKNISIPFDMISQAIKKFKEAEETGAQALVSYCGGCIYLLWATRELIDSKIDLYHIIEIIRMSMDEKINYPDDHIRRAWDIIAIITYSLLLSIAKKNFYIRKITFDKDLSTFKPKKYRLLKILRMLFEISFIRKIFSKLFLLVLPIMKTR